MRQDRRHKQRYHRYPLFGLFQESPACPLYLLDRSGLRDTVRDNGGIDGNGFTFLTYNAGDMLDAVKRAKADYDNKEKWKSLVIRAMCCNFSWEASAETYEKMFEELLEA